MRIELSPIAYVHNTRSELIDDNWGGIISKIILCDHIPEVSFLNIELFSHLEVIYYFDKMPPESISYSRHPRGNKSYMEMGIFAQRNKDRPNSIGLCTVELIDHVERTLTVKNLDAIDGTPVLDIKPVFRQFQPQGEVRQAEWVNDLMKHYW